MSGKKTLRALIKKQIAAHTAEERKSLSACVIARLEQHPKFRAARTVLFFYSMPDEVCTHEVIERYAKEKTLLLPVVVGEELELRQYQGKESMRQGAFRIAEPQGEAYTSFHDIDLIIVPGLAFDAKCHRLGRGRGYYDRLLANPELSEAYKLAICFPFQLVENVPVEAHDLAVNEVLH